MDSVHLETENNYTNRQVIYELDDMSLDNINHKVRSGNPRTTSTLLRCGVSYDFLQNIQTSYQLPTVPQEVHFCAI